MPYVNYNKVTKWTREMILEKLATDDAWVERAILVLTERQVAVEQRTDVLQSVQPNKIGFQPADARWFTKFAISIRTNAANGVPEGSRLSKTQLAYCRRPWNRGSVPIPAIGKYRGQILDIIESKARARLRSISTV